MKFFILLILLSLNIFANNICSEKLEKLPVLNRGRVKPFYVLAKDSLKYLINKTKLNDLSPTEVFCRLSVDDEYKSKTKVPLFVEHIDAIKFLELPDDQKFVYANDIEPMMMKIRSKVVSTKQSTPLKKELTKLLNRYAALIEIQNGNLWTYPEVIEGEIQWLPIAHLKELDINKLNATKKNYIEKEGDTYLLELKYYKSHPFEFAMLSSILAIMLIIIFKKNSYGIFFSLVTLGIEIYAITLRVLISGRAPITNMYETVMFSGFGALIIALLIVLYKRDKLFVIAGLSYNILCLFMMKFANGMLDSTISPLVPVLRDNFWLSTHVSTIILSYAALALSWILANIILIKSRFFSISKKDYRYYESLTNTCIAVGVTLLGAGIILGGIWADYSWGRFWGWDPKETWSLIVLLFYMAILHGKYTNWLNSHKFVLAAAAGFMTVMMAWFGVNYILASGLHSYGFSEGGAIFLGTFFALQTTFILICAKQKKVV